ncbi:MAG: sensor histidine kinase [Lachnospiraceae bacterium]
MSTIRSLCNQYTGLHSEEIEMIEQVSATLQLTANLADADMFVDCPTPEGDAIVVAEAKPSHVTSSYKKSIVGLLAKAENEPAVARTFRLGIATKQVKAVTQESAQVVQYVEPIRNGDKVIGVLIKERHIDEWEIAKESLNSPPQGYKPISDMFIHPEEKNFWIAECIDEALIVVDIGGVITFCNAPAQNLYDGLGFVGPLVGKSYESIRLADINPTGVDNYSFVEVSAGNKFLSIKHLKLGKDEIDFLIIIKDATDIKEREKELILKSVAIKEMHHRIKNNLQTVASLLRLQTRRSGNDETKRVLYESMNRILAIAATHELLARSGVDDVNIMDVILNIKDNTARYHTNGKSKVAIQLKGDDLNVESDLATTVALVINELLQNSLEHAFSSKQTGFIQIIVEKGELYSQIIIIDNGTGFDIESVKNTGSERLGLSIVRALVTDKLRGNLTIKSCESGTNATFTFINKLKYDDATKHGNMQK